MAGFISLNRSYIKPSTYNINLKQDTSLDFNRRLYWSNDDDSQELIPGAPGTIIRRAVDPTLQIARRPFKDGNPMNFNINQTQSIVQQQANLVADLMVYNN
jgi:hypothetical protein